MLDPTVIMKERIGNLAPSILNILNKSLPRDIFPNALKTAIVKPLLKKSTLDHNVLSNFRPVSNQPVLAKIIEKAADKQLSTHFADNDILPDFQ